MSNACGCTGFVAGEDATADGFRIIARTEDLSGAHSKTFTVYPHQGLFCSQERRQNAKKSFEPSVAKEKYTFTSLRGAVRMIALVVHVSVFPLSALF